MLPVVGARRRANVVQLALELIEVGLHKRETELENLVGGSSALQGEPSRGTVARLMDPQARGGRARGKRAQSCKEQSGGEHDGRRLWALRMSPDGHGRCYYNVRRLVSGRSNYRPRIVALSQLMAYRSEEKGEILKRTGTPMGLCPMTLLSTCQEFTLIR